MRGITWQSVSGASAGNPGSSMASAISGFGMAGRGALDLNTDLRLTEDRRNNELTQQTIGGILAAGKPLDASTLGNFAKGVDVTQVLQAVKGYEKTNSDLESAKIDRAYKTELTETEAANNTPEAIQRKIDMENEKLELERQRVAAAQAQVRLSQDASAEGARQRKGVQEMQRLYMDEGPEGLRGQAKSYVEEHWEGILQAQNERLVKSGMSRTERDDFLDTWAPEAKEQLIKQEMGKRQADWLYTTNAKYQLDRDALALTTPGNTIQNVEAMNTKAIAEEATASRKAEEDYRKEAEKALENNAWGSVIPDGNSFKLGKAETLNKGEMPGYLKNELDIRIDPDDTDKAKTILEAVNGNKKIFAEIMSDPTVLTDRDRSVTRFLGDDDDISWEAAASLAAKKEKAIEGFLEAESTKPMKDYSSVMTVDDWIKFNQQKAAAKTRKDKASSKPAAKGSTEQEKKAQLLKALGIGQVDPTSDYTMAP
jgi:hypothetical protein